MEVFNEYLVVEERKKGLIQFCVMRNDKGDSHYIQMPEETYLAYVSVNVDLDSPYFRFGYTSLTTPTTIYDYELATRKKILKKQQEVIGGYRSDDYKSERIWAKAEDGQMVPISLVYKKSAFKTKGNPLLLYGYGSYGHVVDATFSPARLSLLDRGFVFAIAHIRGGEYLGRKWYEDGKLLQKRNTFTDFIACGKYLIQEG